ncbi:MAG: Flp family type IVb pilin [Planctomycetia bacterium]|nr:Flp family type IVb pilin [Planctomycetia bacterium]
MLKRLSADESGAASLEYAMVLAFVVIPLILMFEKLFAILSDYFAMIAYYVSWPFL